MVVRQPYIVTYAYQGVEQELIIVAASSLSAKVEARKLVAAPIIQVKEA